MSHATTAKRVPNKLENHVEELKIYTADVMRGWSVLLLILLIHMECATEKVCLISSLQLNYFYYEHYNSYTHNESSIISNS